MIGDSRKQVGWLVLFGLLFAMSGRAEPSRDLYAALGLKWENRRTYTPADLKAARNAIVRRSHSDVSQGDDRRFQGAIEAYDFLIDPQNKAQYDGVGEQGLTLVFSALRSVLPTKSEGAPRDDRVDYLTGLAEAYESLGIPDGNGGTLSARDYYRKLGEAMLTKKQVVRSRKELALDLLFGAIATLPEAEERELVDHLYGMARRTREVPDAVREAYAAHHSVGAKVRRAWGSVCRRFGWIGEEE